MTRKDEVLHRLREAAGGWVNGSELATAEVGGSEGLKRLRELRAEGVPIEERRHPDPGRAVWQYRIAVDGVRPGECSCGRGPVGHTRDHETTETRGIVRIVREGKTDQYLDYRRMEAQVQDDKRRVASAAEEARLRATPRVDPRSHRLSLGGPLPCDKCEATGGSLWEACIYCEGRGLR